jgi:hypothetical protein
MGEILRGNLPLSARILVLGFMSAESAVMGLRRGWLGMAMSMMTTLFCGEVSRTQMYLSDSMVTCVKVTNCGAIPRLVSCNKQQRQRHGKSQSVERPR